MIIVKPEEKVEIKIWDWLIKDGEYIKQIYFNRKNKINAPIFHTKGINKKPDFLIEFDRGYNDEIIAVEIKTVGQSKNIYDGGKILDYYENYHNNKTTYYINNKIININHFAIATENSLKGMFFNNEKEIINNENGNNIWTKTNSQLKLIPKYEYRRTRDYLRNLWANWRLLKKRVKIQNGSSIGIIIKYENSPILFTMKYVDWLNNKKASWRQRFWRL